MKYYCITPATKDKPGVCVLPTMQEPELGYATVKPVIEQYHKDLDEWEKHLESLPKFPTSCDRAGWFDADLDYQKDAGEGWFSTSERMYEVTLPEFRRKFIVPQSEEKDGPVEQKDEPKDERSEVYFNGIHDALEGQVEPQPAPKTYTESEVREIVGRTWEAAQKWEWVENRNQERVDEGSTHWVNPCPGKETFINTLLPGGR
jgi:hypothetical protein